MLIATVLFFSPAFMWIALAMAAAIFAVALIRRISIGAFARGCLALGTVLLAIAAGQPVWNRAGNRSIVVIVDLSPSTRGATFRDRASLDLRIHELLGDQPFQMLAFAERNQPISESTTLPDIPAEKTGFAPPPADAILLFSDGQFELPAYAPPTYPVIDPALDQPADEAVTELKQIDGQILASLTNSGPARPLKWIGAKPDNPSNPAGNFTQLATPAGSGEVTAFVPPGDRWPENDSLGIVPQPPVQKQKWWIGDDTPAGWVHFSPAELPADSAAFLQSSVVALNDIPADGLSSDQQAHLFQYVRDLGGALVIVGGPHAFAAGGWQNTPIDDLSPLASVPPEPTLQWLLLIDGSGSMAGDPWQTEVTAITRLLPQLPAADPVSVGSFAESLAWWSTGKSAAQTVKLAFPPPNIGPHGPTNLAATLDEIAAKSDGASPAELLLMTDADAELPHPTELTAAMKAKKIHLHLLATGAGSALPALRSVASATGGSVIQQLEPQQWISSANLLLRSAMPDHYQHRTIQLNPPPPVSISEWNQTWLKANATALQKSGNIPTIARWQFGIGQVIAIAYPADAAEVEKFATRIQQPPGDPRFAVTWESGSRLRVKVDAVDHDQYLNGLSVTLEILDARSGNAKPDTMPIPQIGPGEYEVTMPSSRSPQLLCVRNGNQELRRFAIAGRYPPEFEAIGNNRANLQSLADRTGGSVIPPGPVKPIDFPRSTIQITLAPEFAFGGFVLIAAGMVRYRRHG